jgi:hypothetical protein
MSPYRELMVGDLRAYLEDVLALAERPGRLWLVGETSQLLEGWCAGVRRFTLATGDGAPPPRALGPLEARRGVDIVWESPADILPLPPGYAARARPTGIGRDVADGRFEVWHFDPYSVAFRLISRGNEEDYRTVLRYLEHDWITEEEIDALLADLLPRFTTQTIEQDPAEFRRKYKGLRQMWRATRP